ncbi:MAG: ATP-binding protein [Anaerolineae bacterium]|nr:ATP-binding protein [Anaerolineae bacterium]
MEPLTVPGTLDSLSVIGKYVMDLSAKAGLDKKAAYRLRLAVDEIATNIVMHGYDEADRQGNLDLRAEIDDTTLSIFLEDTGVTYKPGQVSKRADLHLPLEERQIGGLGVYLAIQGVDQFHYEHFEGRNRHIFVVKRSST